VGSVCGRQSKNQRRLRLSIGGVLTEDELHSGVIGVVRADPIPHDQVTVLLTEGAILLGDANRPDAGTDFFKMERGMERMPLPEVVFLPREFLSVGGQLLKTLPE